MHRRPILGWVFAGSLVPILLTSWLGSPAEARAQSCQGGWVPELVTARNAHAMAYDRARGVTVLFGGSDQTPEGDTWVWGGSVWTRRATGGPSPRTGHAMAYDSARGATVLFGGTANGPNGETWEWDGNSWTLKATSGPSSRSKHAMAYDSARGVTVLFGGFDGGARSGETWEWDGHAWTLK